MLEFADLLRPLPVMRRCKKQAETSPSISRSRYISREGA